MVIYERCFDYQVLFLQGAHSAEQAPFMRVFVFYQAGTPFMRVFVFYQAGTPFMRAFVFYHAGTPFMRAFPSGTHLSVYLTEAMWIRYLAQDHNILMQLRSEWLSSVS